MMLAILIITSINLILLLMLGWHTPMAREVHQRLSSIELILSDIELKLK